MKPKTKTSKVKLSNILFDNAEAARTDAIEQLRMAADELERGADANDVQEMVATAFMLIGESLSYRNAAHDVAAS